MDRITRRSVEERVVTINAVDMTSYFVSARDQYGSNLQITMNLYDGGVTTIPAPDEIWTVKRSGSQWFLGKKSENGTETTAITSMVAGDKRVEAVGNLYLNGTNVSINGVTFKRATGSASISTSVSTLNVTHGLGTTPSFVILTPTSDTQGLRWWVSAKTSTLFTITLSAIPTTNPVTFDWLAIL